MNHLPIVSSRGKYQGGENKLKTQAESVRIRDIFLAGQNPTLKKDQFHERLCEVDALAWTSLNPSLRFSQLHVELSSSITVSWTDRGWTGATLAFCNGEQRGLTSGPQRGEAVWIGSLEKWHFAALDWAKPGISNYRHLGHFLRKQQARPVVFSPCVQYLLAHTLRV